MSFFIKRKESYERRKILQKSKEMQGRQYIVMHIVIVAVQNLFQMMNILFVLNVDLNTPRKMIMLNFIRNRKW